MVLLHTLSALAGENRWQLSVAHFNHQLRGPASVADEKLVRQAAKKLSLEFFYEAADVQRFAEQSKISIEMAARKLRHEFLAHTANKNKIPTIALAHHADDQVELFFLRLLRGAGGEGMAGMKWQSASPADGKISLVRPLLASSKTDLLEFARAQKIKFHEDASNAASDFLRNRIRHELLPLLRKKYQPGINKTVLRLMEIVSAENEFVSAASEHAPLGGSDFYTLPVAIQRRFLQRELLAAGVAVDFDLIESLRAAPDKFVSAGAEVAVARDKSGKIKLERTVSEKFISAEQRLKLTGRAGGAVFGGRKFKWQIRSGKSFLIPAAKNGTEYFDADKVGAEIIFRHWRPGDRFQPIGMKPAVKLQDLFVNAKIPQARRRELVLATTLPGDIFWVEGLRIGEQFKLTPPTRRQLALTWRI